MSEAKVESDNKEDTTDNAGKGAASRKILRSSGQMAIDAGYPFRIRTIDISAGGLLVVSPNSCAMNAAVELNFGLPLPDGKIAKIHVKGRVRYCVLSDKDGGFRVGIQFDQMSSSSADAVVRFLK